MNEVALRRLRRRPGRGSATAMTRATGIGAVTAAFAVVDGVLLRTFRSSTRASSSWPGTPTRRYARRPRIPPSPFVTSSKTGPTDDEAWHVTNARARATTLPHADPGPTLPDGTIDDGVVQQSNGRPLTCPFKSGI